MSYACYGKGDVYVIRVARCWACVWCRLYGGYPTVYCPSLTELAIHMAIHEKNGHRVTEELRWRISKERATGRTINGRPIPVERR